MNRKSYFRILSLLLILSFSISGLEAQKNKKYQSKSPEYSISDAKAISSKDPKQAIFILNEIIADATKSDDSQMIMEAYTLLGDINLQNNLFSQAGDRYLKASEFAVILNDKYQIARLHSKSGSAFSKSNVILSYKSYNTCMQYAIGDSLYYSCYEGFGDALLSLDSLDSSLKVFRDIEDKYIVSKDNHLARIQAKIADVLARQNKVPEALDAYQNAQSNFQVINNAQDIPILQNSTNSITSKQLPTEQIKLRNSNVGIYAVTPAKEAEEKLEIAKVFVKQGNTTAARLKLEELKPLITTIESSDTKAEYYRRSSELFSLEGNYKLAIEEYNKYELTRNQLLDEKEKLLNSRLEINDLQNSIDIDEKGFINERDRIAYQKNLVSRQYWIIYLLLALLLGSLLASYFIYRNVKAKMKANQKLELRSLRSEMNPHFIFNALGSVNEYIALNDEVKANRFLNDFSKLMRQVLELNQKDLVPLRSEIELSKLYLKLEHARWGDRFDYKFEINEQEIPENILVPPLILQPYIENAIWHGLRYREEKGMLNVEMNLKSGNPHIIISDNGIGREKSTALKTKNQKNYSSTGIKNTLKRAELINKLYNKNYKVEINDYRPNDDNPGTLVKVSLTS